MIALATPLFANGKYCGKVATISYNGKSTYATVVDHCDVRHNCPIDVVDASKVVWDALGLDYDIGIVQGITLVIN